MRTIRGLSIGVLAALCGLVCYEFGRFVLIDADEANFFLAARAMARGNILLRGWSLPPDNFWPLDLGGMAVFIRATGAPAIAPAIAPHVMAALWLAGVVAAALTLANRPDRPWSGARLLPVLLFVGLPLFAARGAIAFLTFTPYHVATLGACLWGLVLVQRSQVSGRLGVGTGAGLFALCAALAFGDFLGVVVFVAPMIAVVWRGRADARNIPPRVIGIAIAACVSGIVLRRLPGHVGGFTTSGLHPAFIGAAMLGPRLQASIAAVLDLFGVDVLGRSFVGHHGDNALAPLSRLPGFALIALFVGRRMVGLRQDRASRDAPDAISRILLLGAGIDAASAFLSDFHIRGEDVIRYFYPAMVFVVIAYAREARAVRRDAFLLGLVVTIAVSVPAWRDWRAHGRPFIDPFGLGHQIDPAPLLAALNAGHLHRGYAGYWDAALLRLASDATIDARAVRAVSAAPDIAGRPSCALVPYRWIADRTAPSGAAGPDDRIFFVTRAGTGEPFATLTQGSVLAALGAPDRVIPVDPATTIDVYSRPRLAARCPSLTRP